MLKILSLPEIKEVEAATMRHDSITSWQLMERAATAICSSFMSIYSPCCVYICLGKGGNGGDGLALGRMLSQNGCDVSMLTIFDSDSCSGDYQKNLLLLPDDISVTSDIDLFFSKVESGGVLVDAIFGVGYRSRSLDPKIGKIISLANRLDRDLCEVVAIDIPSGMEAGVEAVVDDQICFRCDKTFTVYSPKLSMLLPSCGDYVGDIITVDIGYSEVAINSVECNHFYINSIKEQKRLKFSHKGNFGSLLIVGAGRGMFGASIIAAKGAEVAGCGLIRVVTPKSLLSSLYSNTPAAMAHIIDDEYLCTTPSDLERYNVVCVGMGMGKEDKTISAFRELLRRCGESFISMVIDADGLNIISQQSDIRGLIPPNSILTPHVGEFKRLVGGFSSESDKLLKLKLLAEQTKSVVVLKGAHTVIATATGELYFNSTGCSALARGGAGDLLSGIVAARLACSGDLLYSAISGVFYHGAAAERAAAKYGTSQSTIARIVDSY